MNNLKAFLFWYKSDEFAPTEYLYIIALTEKQACYYWIKRGYKRMYDYADFPIDVIYEKDFIKKHQNGEMLGQYAII